MECTLCDVTCQNHDELENHLASVHEGKNPLECTICGFIFTNRNNLLNHHRIVHEKKKRNACKLCGTGFKTRGLLKLHIKDDHKINLVLETVKFPPIQQLCKYTFYHNSIIVHKVAGSSATALCCLLVPQANRTREKGTKSALETTNVQPG